MCIKNTWRFFKTSFLEEVEEEIDIILIEDDTCQDISDYLQARADYLLQSDSPT